jgi:hypothetical protein
MSVYHRYFRFTDGPLIEQIDALFEARIAAGKLYRTLADKYGAVDAHNYDRSGEFAGFRFSLTNPPDKNVFRFVAKHRLWLPRKNVPAGKEVWEEINQLPKPKPIESVLEQVGLTTGFPDVWEGGKGYAPQIWGYGSPRNIWYVAVPWKDIDPSKIEAYKADLPHGARHDREIGAMLWTPPAEWQEVKRWEIEKEVDEIKASETELDEEDV